jgi:hypothetical protein
MRKCALHYYNGRFFMWSPLPAVRDQRVTTNSEVVNGNKSEEEPTVVHEG